LTLWRGRIFFSLESTTLNKFFSVNVKDIEKYT